MRNLWFTLSLAFLPLLAFGQDKVTKYIALYADIAISEMHRSGIPASITLAQGMFESSYGESPSALSYNNHFGIKCKKDWTGPYYYKKDDDRDKYGNLIESCFRAYATVGASYQDHTNFLIERERYAELFTFSKSDYVNWALGLERCGYATNKMYAERLIEIIERYALNQFDSSERRVLVDIPESVTEEREERTTEVIVVQPASMVQETTTSVIAEYNTPASTSEQQPQVFQPEIIQDKAVDDGPVITTTLEANPVIETPEETYNFIPLESGGIAIGEPVKVVQTMVDDQPSLTITKDTLQTSRLIIKEAPSKINRVEKAIILPSGYQRKNNATTSSSNME